MNDKTEKDYLLLKWGTVKSWRMRNADAFATLKKWSELGYTLSAMAQHDTPEQKELLCKLIREHPDLDIQNDWDGEVYTKEKAIHYINNYGK